MSENQVRRVRTSLVPGDVYGALRLACMAFGAPLERRGLLIFLAQVWHETDGGHSSFGWNLAGIKWAPGCGCDYYTAPTTELEDGKDKLVDANFRSYSSLKDGAYDFVRLIGVRFVSAWSAAAAGDIDAYAHNLKTGGYYTAVEGAYDRALRARFAQLDPLIAGDTVPATPSAINVIHPPVPDGPTGDPPPPDPEDEPA
jgi:hypothetical protein